MFPVKVLLVFAQLLEVNGLVCSPGYEVDLTAVPPVCVICDYGHFEQLATCKVCPAGRYANVQGLTDCLDCPEGTYLADDGQLWQLHAHEAFCTACPPGRASNQAAAASCTECPRGQYSSSPGSTGCESCIFGVAAEPGTILCGQCSPGYRPSSDRTQCEPCPAGQQGNDGLSCFECWYGQVSAEGSSSCTSCANGKAATNFTECLDCPAGKTSWSGGECYDCWYGEYSVAGGACEPCSAGRFSNTIGSSNCSLCAAGTSAPEFASSCDVCWWGTYATEGSASCEFCPGGSAPRSDKSACDPCPAGQHAPDNYGWESCMPCWQGYAPAGSAECLSCPDGQMPKSDRTGCQACPAGEYAREGQEMCFPCGEGSSRAENESTCQDCPPGRFNSQTTSASCAECPGGRYSDEPGRSLCKPCPIGRYYNDTGSNASSVCSQCPGGQTQAAGAYSDDACLQPGTNQSVECVAGKTCSFVFAQGPGLLDTGVHSVQVKAGSCEPDPDNLAQILDVLDDFADGYGDGDSPDGFYGGGGFYGGFPGGYNGGFPGGFSAGPFGSGFYGGYGPGRRLQPGTTVAGFGTARVWIDSNFTVAWPDQISATPGIYKLCWCGGFGFYGFRVPQSFRCVQSDLYDFEVGVMTVAGPFPGQSFSCVRGRVCNAGKVRGLGLTAEDQLHLRAGCTLDGARRFPGVPFWVSAVASDLPGEVDLEFGLNYTVLDSPGDYNLCWCSSKGTACSTMDLSVDGTSDVYLETYAASLSLDGPHTGAEAECFLGQVCWLVLTGGGQNLRDGDTLSALSRCGEDDTFLTGFPLPGYAPATSNGALFIFGSGDLSTEPGIYQMCWCRPDPDIGVLCTTAPDFSTSIGLFLATGPYSGQTAQCVLGSACSVPTFRGVSLSPNDPIMPLASCAKQLPSVNFPEPSPIYLSVTNGGLAFNLGELQLANGVVPETIQLCWCSKRFDPDGEGLPACIVGWHFGAVAVTLTVVCPPGWYELVGASKTCQRCPPGYYCPGGPGALQTACPVGSTSELGASTIDSCQCRRGYYVDVAVGACLACPAGYFKNSVDRLEECSAQCPPQTTSGTTAASIAECYCQGSAVDMNPAPGEFECVELVNLGKFSSNDHAPVASTMALVHTFNGSVTVVDASTQDLLDEIYEELAEHLQITTGTRASFTLEVGSVTDWRLDFEIASSDPELAAELRAKLEAAPFQAWIYSKMSATELDSANLTVVSELQSVVLQCPTGLGFQPGSYVTSLADCKCPHGMQPATDGSTGILAGCTSCPVGTYKSSVGDIACSPCPTRAVPLTTLQPGAIASAACTCSAGYRIDEMNPDRCKDCGDGYFCLGGSHQEACVDERTTATATAASPNDCLCADGASLNDTTGQCDLCRPGRFKGVVGNDPCSECVAGQFSELGYDACKDCRAGRFSATGAGTCELCPAGRYSLVDLATSVESCILCPIGTWSHDTGAKSETTCIPCPVGSTTEQSGSTNITACVRPHPDQAHQCVSGRACTLYGLAGDGLRAGHRLGITLADCASAKVAVTNIANDGISKASDAASTYVWGDQAADFTPEGGFYNLCWCANMQTLVCTDLNANYVTLAGQLLVAGPSVNSFECVRGRDCVDLSPFSGFELGTEDVVALRRDSCGTTAATEISSSNTDGIGSLSNLQQQGAVTTLALGFGVSDDVNSYDLAIDADAAGYLLCWCASGRGVDSACTSPEEFNVYAGRISVVGPRTNQESGCSVGQPCSVSGIQGARIAAGDRLMVLSDCGRGIALPGFPSSGILETSNSLDFAFTGNGSDILLSSPGIFRLCFCRPFPDNGEPCEQPKSFRAKVGLMTASGPFEQTATCNTGANCTLVLSGIGLQVGDRVFIADDACGQAAGMGARGFPQLEFSIPVVDGTSGLEASLGELPQAAMAGQYSICWCPASAGCADPSVFQAPGGSLRVDCPPGSFAIGPTGGQICERCTRGYYCGGGRPALATRVACANGETTLLMGSVSMAACVCERGYELSGSSCSPCSKGSYKFLPGNTWACLPCPTGFTTFSTGSRSKSFCAIPIEVTASDPSSNQSNATNDTTVSNLTDTQGPSPPAELVLKNESAVPAIRFNMSMSQLPTDGDAEMLRNQLKATFISTLSASTRADPDAIQIEILEDGQASNSTGRRLATGATVVVTIKQRTAEEAALTLEDMDVELISVELENAVEQHPTLSSAGIDLTVESAPEITETSVKCPARRSVPPGVPVLSEGDCQCSPGYGFDSASGTCSLCEQGGYKADVGDVSCTRCPELMSTLGSGATSPNDCQCQVGLYADDTGACVECKFGHYCAGTGEAVPCPKNSTTTSAGRSIDDCICMAGFYSVDDETRCQPCQRGKYKPNIGNGECPLTCPTSASSDLGGAGLEDCFCQPGFHAITDNGVLARCAMCDYTGLICLGGFEGSNLTSLDGQPVPRTHAQPIAEPGFYQTGQTSAVACDVFVVEEVSACGGGAACAAQRVGLPVPATCHGSQGNNCSEGSTGLLCGECPNNWARDGYPELCSRCPNNPASAVTMGVLYDIFTKTVLNFAVAVMAATAAVKGGTKLHTSMIRVGTQWLSACSVLTQFDLGSVGGFGWSEKQKELEQLQECADNNITVNDCPLGSQGLEFPWPEEVTQAMDGVFEIMKIMPKVATVEMSAECHAESLLPGNKVAKNLAPAIYHVSSPLLAMLGVFLICAAFVYILIPLLQKFGLEMNGAGRKTRKRESAIKTLKKALVKPLEEVGVTWADVQASGVLDMETTGAILDDSEDPHAFIAGKLAADKVLAVKMCLHKSREDPHFASLCADAELSWEELSKNPELLVKDIDRQSLQKAVAHGMPPSLLESCVLRALAWKLHPKFQEEAVELGVSLEDLAIEVATRCDTPSELVKKQANWREMNKLVRSACRELRHRPAPPPDDVVIATSHPKILELLEDNPEPSLQGVDPESLDFGLFTSYPRPGRLFFQCVPVFWVTLIGMWPELLSSFLQMIRCRAIQEDDPVTGIQIMKQRLRSHPEVVCWGSDHFLLALIACIGLGVWCLGVPVLLFIRIYALRDRQSPENYRKYGYFIQGFEPGFWWWDIIVKRVDIGLMNIVTYTNLANDEKAKLLLFPFMSGIQLAICAWCRPFTNSQAEILDFLEMCLLSFRFVLFSMVAVMLIFNPSAEMTWVLAGLLVCLLSIVCGYFALHVAAQFLRTAGQDEESDEEERLTTSPTMVTSATTLTPRTKRKRKINCFLRLLGSFKAWLMRTASFFLKASDDEQFVVAWSIYMPHVELVSLAPPRQTSGGFSARVETYARGLRASVLRFGSGVQRQVIVKAFSEFSTLWLEEFSQPYLPAAAVQILCALATTAMRVPPKTPKDGVFRKWRQEVETLLEYCTDPQQTFHVSPDDILEVAQRLGKLGETEAVRLVEGIQTTLHTYKQKELRRATVASAASAGSGKDASVDGGADDSGWLAVGPLESNNPECPDEDADLRQLASPTLQDTLDAANKETVEKVAVREQAVQTKQTSMAPKKRRQPELTDKPANQLSIQ